MSKKQIRIRRGEAVGGKTVMSMLDHCLTNIEQHGFKDNIEWKTEIAKDVTVEELIGALVRSETEFNRIKEVK